MNIRNRVKSLRMVPASDLRPNPKNWRTHPKAQQDALRGVLAEVGLADACLARELPDGSLMLIDGHLRAETLGDGDVPVLVLDVNEAEADKILATLDPLAAMAEANEEMLAEIKKSLREPSGKRDATEAEQPGGDHDSDGHEIPSSVRMVQLFFDQDSADEFYELTSRLSAAYKTESVTDTVLSVLAKEMEA
jgi:hypothetical protein